MIACTSRNRCALFIWVLACSNLFVNSDKIRGFRKNKNMSEKDMDTRQLLERLSRLEKENSLLKEILENAGIDYETVISDEPSGYSEQYDPDQGGRIHPIEVTDKVANQFFMLFCRGRKEVYELRYTNPKTGRTGYYTQCFNRWDRECHKQKKDNVRCKDCEIQAYKPLNYHLIKAHMEGNDSYGNDVIAIYPMLEGNVCQLLVFDFDNHAAGAAQTDYANTDNSWKSEVSALRKICRILGIDCAVERSRSGNGAHLWIFFKELVPAKLARRFGFALLDKGAESVNLKSFKYYDRMIPAQDMLPKGGLGNVIALPLQGQALKSGNSAFVDEAWNAYPDQLMFLSGVKRLSKAELEKILQKWTGQEITNPESVENEDAEPWEKGNGFHKSEVIGKADLIISNRLYVDTSNISNKMKRDIRRMAAFSNRQYFQNLAMDLPNYNTPRYIYLGSDEGKYIVLPRGLSEKMLSKLTQADIPYSIRDKRSEGKPVRVRFNGKLRESQKEAVKAMMAHDNGILHAATAFGKTVVCCNIIAERQVNTLILVDKADLMNQWIERLHEFLVIDEKLPKYKTKSGQIRTRKKLIGNLQGPHDTLTGIVDVAMIRSLKRKDGFHPLLKEYGQVIMDECHHAASDSAIEVLQEVQAKYVYGVTATPKRGDGKEKINEFLLGPIRYRFTEKDRAREQNIGHFVYPRFTRTVAPHHLSKTPYGNAAFELIRNNEVRDAQITEEVAACVKNGRTPVVLTKYVDHAERLAERLKQDADRVILLTGKNGTKARHKQVDDLKHVSKSETLILVGTGSLLGEGFDYPRLDTLFMATPVSGENVVEQYAGRLNRDYKSKKNVIVYDYVDCHIPKFDKMYASSLKAYKKIGYELYSGREDEADGQLNAIYDIETYAETFWHDIELAKYSVVISSPRLNADKVSRLIKTIGKCQENGTKCTIVTWHPDVYGLEKSEARMALLERLRKAGFEIYYLEETCEHFAVIDQNVVWYGSMELLAKPDVEDNLMRVRSGKIAAELLELTFGEAKNLQKW